MLWTLGFWNYHDLRQSIVVVIVFLLQLYSTTAALICSGAQLGHPAEQQCLNALAFLPRNEIARFFVDQQLRSLSNADWKAFRDPRPLDKRQLVVQVPKWWSSGQCLPPLNPCRSSLAGLIMVIRSPINDLLSMYFDINSY